MACLFTLVSLGISIWSLARFSAADWTTWCSVTSAVLSLGFLHMIREGPQVTTASRTTTQVVDPHTTIADPSMVEIPLNDVVTEQVGKQVDSVAAKALSSGVGAGVKVHKAAQSTNSSVYDKVAIGAAVASVVAISVFNSAVTTAVSSSRVYTATNSLGGCAFLQGYSKSSDMTISPSCCSAVSQYSSQWGACYNSITNWGTQQIPPAQLQATRTCLNQAMSTFSAHRNPTLQQALYYDGQFLVCIGKQISSSCLSMGQNLVSKCS
ncbi:uncharacterized protein BJ171DRAFT_484683 [Polychytrium aggregatum]|uniref:uncharacterized protein n=1 Tax=Polychytrium aggregatum TaxID=110093 RepID=UPI0022FF0AF0|nr:uncharacterized protein BJ171DRAFT_484683 [Polychytrium aggregatum]KAI9209671.1 hypothetical protein BJ171DRAFT_484683 [Polychytrium aggregatum]